MSKQQFHTLSTLLSALLLLWLAGKYLLPLTLPFLLGLLLALAAEPAVGLLHRHLPLGRGAAAFLGVTAAFVFLSALAVLLLSLLLRELGHLAGILPDLERSARQGLTSLESWLLNLAMASPEGIRPLLTRSVLGLFENGSDLYDQALSQLPRLATGILSHVPGSFLFFGTALLSSYLISGRLPRLRQWLRKLLPDAWQSRWLPAIRSLKDALSGWLRAQLRLMGITFLLVWAGLFLLGVRFAPVWALGIALVDAVPMLGTGLILLPWSLICFLRADHLRALGMLGIFACATVTRATLEPRLLGRQLGLDPLVTLLAMYLGYQLLGLPGLLLSPVLAVTLVQILKTTRREDPS